MAFKASRIVSQKRWFPENGLKFSCTQCGKCCRGKVNVFLNATEANDIADYLKMNKFEFFKKYTEERETSDGVTTSLKSKVNVPECVFLDGKKCSIYDVRPTQCRTYPWWPSNLIGEAEWKAEANRCEGIVIDAIGPAAETAYLDERLVPTKDIVHNLVLHQVHGRGMGIDMNYEDASESLIESENQSPGMVEEFEQDFFSTHFSRTLYEDDVIRVVETTIPAPEDDAGYTDPTHPHNKGIATNVTINTGTATAVGMTTTGISGGAVAVNSTSTGTLSSSPTSSSISLATNGTEVHNSTAAEVNHVHMDEAIHHMQEETHNPSEQAKLETYRRLEFIRSPHMTQTEVKMLESSRRRKEDNTIRKVDYAQLLMPVHQVLAKLIKLELNSERPQVVLGGENHKSAAAIDSNSFLEVLGGAVSKAVSGHGVKKQNWWRFLVLGAGGCALPMNILQDKSVDPAYRLTIDAVEPLDGVLYCAEMYFGAVWGNSGSEDCVRVLRPHNDDAYNYLSESSFSNYDVIVLDAFEDFTVDRSSIHQEPLLSISSSPVTVTMNPVSAAVPLAVSPVVATPVAVALHQLDGIATQHQQPSRSYSSSLSSSATGSHSSDTEYIHKSVAAVTVSKTMTSKKAGTGALAIPLSTSSSETTSADDSNIKESMLDDGDSTGGGDLNYLRSRAPPISLLDPNYLSLMLHAMNDAGVLMINVYGSLKWATNVYQCIYKASSVLGFDRPILLKMQDPNARPTLPPHDMSHSNPPANPRASELPDDDGSDSYMDSNFILVVSKVKHHSRELANGVVGDGNCMIVDTKK